MINRFAFYRELGLKAMQQVPENKLFVRLNEESNSIAIIINHLHGNMLSRWTDFLTTDGEKEWRQRDAEFEDRVKDKTILLKKWDEGWDCVFETMESLQPDDLLRTVTVRGENHSVLDAINRQFAHYAYHVGQIVFLAKYFVNDKWMSLSIPRKK